MPYLLKKIKNGYKVCKKDDSKCFSKKPLTKSTATTDNTNFILENEASDILDFSEVNPFGEL